jgi:hypothetical protein
MNDSYIVDELKAIADEHDGMLLPQDVVEAAKLKSSPLHSYFEWDDKKASYQFRLEQARRLIRVSVDVVEGANKENRVFVSLTSDRVAGGGYRTLVSVMSTERGRSALLEDALSELRMFRKKYERLRELAEVFRAIDGLDGNKS